MELAPELLTLSEDINVIE